MPNLTCSIEGCGKLVYIQKIGLCAMHNARRRKYGDALYAVKVYDIPDRPKPVQFEALSKVMPSGCHEWQGRLLKDGYGGFQTLRAHRWVWEEANGTIPNGMMIRHKCDNPPCVNIEHLELGTSQDNADDKVERGRSLKGSKNPIAKLDEAMVREIRIALRDNTAKQKDLALKYGVTFGIISNIKRGRAWKHVTIEGRIADN